MTLKRFPNFGKELRQPFKMADQCYNCAGLFAKCEGYPADSGATCRNFKALPDVGPETEGQPMPKNPPTRPKLSRPGKDKPSVRRVAAFAKNVCANYDPHYQTCIDGAPCRIVRGEPCGYFERAVLGPPEYPYKVAGYDYAVLFDEYARINPKFRGSDVKIRYCDCGATLKPRERVCRKCRDRRRRESYRESKRKNRQNGRVSTVNSETPQNIAV